MVVAATTGLAAICGVGGKFLFGPNRVGGRGICVERERRNGGSGQRKQPQGCEEAAAGRLTEQGKAFILNK
jgi:hypothetical protein